MNTIYSTISNSASEVGATALLGAKALSVGLGIVGTWRMYKGVEGITAAQQPENANRRSEIFKQVHENHFKGVSLLTGSAFISALTTGDITYLASQLATFQPSATVNYYNSHPEEFEKLPVVSKKIVQFLKENINLESIVGMNVLVLLAFIASGVGTNTIIQLLGASTISSALMALPKLTEKNKKLGDIHFQILLLAGRIGMLTPSLIKSVESLSSGDVNPGSISWTVLMTIFSLISGNLVYKSFKGVKEKDPTLSWQEVFGELGNSIGGISDEMYRKWGKLLHSNPVTRGMYEDFEVKRKQFPQFSS